MKILIAYYVIFTGRNMEFKRLPTLRDIDLRGAKVLVRVDFNNPLNEEGDIIDDSRLRAHLETIDYLISEGAATVLVTHQGRPGNKDFASLEKHRDRLEELLGSEVKFIEDVMGPAALSGIRELKSGEVLLLDNLRFVSEEIIEAPPEKQVNTYLVRRLSKLFNYFVFDAFATSHRSQPSIVGFPMALPSVIGALMEKEIEALKKVMTSQSKPRVYVLGGAKVRDTIKIVEFLTKNKVADRVLTCGLVGLVFHVAKGGRVSSEVMKTLEEWGFLTLFPRARKVLLSGAPVDTPYDYLVLRGDGEVAEDPVHSLSGRPMDIGPYTLGMYTEMIKEASVVVMRGPAGVIEDERFKGGTESLLRAALSSSAYVVIGGGHLGALVKDVPKSGRVHVSTGGGALLVALSGEPLPALEALQVSARKFFGWD